MLIQYAGIIKLLDLFQLIGSGLAVCRFHNCITHFLLLLFLDKVWHTETKQKSEYSEDKSSYAPKYKLICTVTLVLQYFY